MRRRELKMGKFLESMEWINLVSLFSRECVYEMKARQCYIKCVEWGEVLAKIKNMIGGKFGKLTENESEVASCVSYWFKGCFGQFWTWEMGWRKHEKSGTWERVEWASCTISIFSFWLNAWKHEYAWKSSYLGFLGKEKNDACDGNGTCMAFWSKSCQIGQCMETSQDQCMFTQPSLHDYLLMHVHPKFTHLVSIERGKIK